MGQQQLLLLVLGIVIVGIAVVAGIQAFSEGKVKAEQDAAVSDAMRIISDVQAWKLKPGAFGGGADLDDTEFTGVHFKSLGYPVTNVESYGTINGCYELTGDATSAEIIIFSAMTQALVDHDADPGTPDRQETTCTPGTEIATVDVTGPGTDDIAWTYAE
jgi:hypothetical protein